MGFSADVLQAALGDKSSSTLAWPKRRLMYEYQGVVTHIVDGDTVDVDIDLGFKIHKLTRIRLAGIDAPELRGKEKVAGHVASTFLMSLIPTGTAVRLVTEKEQGKYGRYIAWIFVSKDGEEQDVNSEMLKSGHAVPYV